jgi:hypothetical protein
MFCYLGSCIITKHVATCLMSLDPGINSRPVTKNGSCAMIGSLYQAVNCRLSKKQIPRANTSQRGSQSAGLAFQAQQYLGLTRRVLGVLSRTGRRHPICHSKFPCF